MNGAHKEDDDEAVKIGLVGATVEQRSLVTSCKAVKREKHQKGERRQLPSHFGPSFQSPGMRYGTGGIYTSFTLLTLCGSAYCYHCDPKFEEISLTTSTTSHFMSSTTKGKGFFLSLHEPLDQPSHYDTFLSSKDKGKIRHRQKNKRVSNSFKIRSSAQNARNFIPRASAVQTLNHASFTHRQQWQEDSLLLLQQTSLNANLKFACISSAWKEAQTPLQKSGHATQTALGVASCCRGEIAALKQHIYKPN